MPGPSTLNTTRPFLVFAAAFALISLLLPACGSQGESVSLFTPTPIAPTVAPSVTPSLLVSPTASPAAGFLIPLPAGVAGFVFPIAGACLPRSSDLLPNAPRTYRFGIHEGVDFYDKAACADIVRGTPVLAAKGGIVGRADWDYGPLTFQELAELQARSQAQGYTDVIALDRFRGRQVWIDHGSGIVTRYAHLEAIAPGIVAGWPVTAGQVIGYVGNSGIPESLDDANAEIHLHFEIRIGDSYLGAGLPLNEVRALLVQAFSP